MGRKRGFCGDGDYMVRSFNLPIRLIELLGEFVTSTGKGLNETVSKGICHEIGIDWETVKAENEMQHPRKLLIAEVVHDA